MKTQRFLIAYEGTFSDGRSLNAVEIKAMVDNFNYEELIVPVTYAHYSWSPLLSEVIALGCDVIDYRIHLYAEIKVTDELKEIAGRKLTYHLTPEVMPGERNNYALTRLVGVGVTQNPIIPGLDILQFDRVNHENAILRSGQ
ncbi:GPO family capsid scaffolding protein [Serratia marcescens]